MPRDLRQVAAVATIEFRLNFDDLLSEITARNGGLEPF
jgi:hypothetical protein